MSECTCDKVVKKVMENMREDIYDMVMKYKDKITPHQFIAILMDNAVDLACECSKDRHKAFSALLTIMSKLITLKDEQDLGLEKKNDDEEVDQ